MSLGHSPFYLQQLVASGRRGEAIALARPTAPCNSD